MRIKTQNRSGNHVGSSPTIGTKQAVRTFSGSGLLYFCCKSYLCVLRENADDGIGRGYLAGKIQMGIRRLAFVPPYFVFCSISFRCGGLSIERNQKPSTPENTLAVTHHDKQKQVEVKRSSRANPHEIRLFSGCPYAVVK